MRTNVPTLLLLTLGAAQWTLQRPRALTVRRPVSTPDDTREPWGDPDNGGSDDAWHIGKPGPLPEPDPKPEQRQEGRGWERYALPFRPRSNEQEPPEPRPLRGVECPQCGGERVTWDSDGMAWCRVCDELVDPNKAS